MARIGENHQNPTEILGFENQFHYLHKRKVANLGFCDILPQIIYLIRVDDFIFATYMKQNEILIRTSKLFYSISKNKS